MHPSRLMFRVLYLICMYSISINSKFFLLFADAAPVVEMVRPAAGETFAVGDFLRLRARVYDDEDSSAVLLDANASQLTWQVDICWTPSQCSVSLLSSSSVTGNNLNTDLPAPEPRDFNVLRSAFVRVRVTYKNDDMANNESILMERQVFPELIDISFQSEPSFARVYLRIMGGVLVFPPTTLGFWKQQKLALDAPDQRPYLFVEWGHGLPQEHEVVVNKKTTYTAYFQRPTPEPTEEPLPPSSLPPKTTRAPTRAPTTPAPVSCLPLGQFCSAGDVCCGGNNYICRGVCSRVIDEDEKDKASLKLSKNSARGQLGRRRQLSSEQRKQRGRPRLVKGSA